MKLQPQLYIDTSGNPLGEPNYERVEFFDFESIEITSTVQDIRDISKVFTDYTQSFSVPASKVNNKIFRHYYRTDVDNGFDARIKQKAELHLNGILFRTGYVRLTKSVLSEGKASSYRITFFGELTKLSNVIGNALLSDLSYLDRFNHAYNIDNVWFGFTQGLSDSGGTVGASNNRDIVYPSITASNKWIYRQTTPTEANSSNDDDIFLGEQSSNQGITNNLYVYNNEFNNYGIDWLQLKPAIKLKHIIDAIEEKYESITFSDDFFGTADFDDVYMLLHNNKGILSPSTSDIEDRTVTYRVGVDGNSDFNLDPTFTEQRPMETYWQYVFRNKVRIIQYHVIIDISNTVISGGGGGTPNYTLEVLDGATVIDRVELSGDQQYTSVLCTQETKRWDNVNIRITSPSDQLSTFEIDLELKMVRYKMGAGSTYEYLCDVNNFNDIPETESSLYSTDSVTQSLVQKIEITRNIPKMKILDFLTGLFKMYNLTAKVNDEGIIVVKTLNEYYNDGNTIDITTMIDSSDVSVNRMDLFSSIDFKFKDAKTFGIKKNNELLQTDFGNLEYQATSDGTNSSLIFDGKKYSVSLPFEKMYFERVYDQSNTTLKTSISHGWLVDDSQSDVLTNPIIFINIPQEVDSSKTLFGIKGKGIVTQYNRAANTNASEYWDGSSWQEGFGTKSISFNREFDEFTKNEVSRGLFRNYYNDYIATVFDRNTRIFEIEMNASLSFLLNYKVNDTLTIKGEEYLINSIRTNLTNGKTKLELILKFFTEIQEDTTGEPLTTPTGLYLVYRSNTAWKVGWNENPSNQLVKGYKIYVDGTLDATLLRTSNYTKTSLPANTTYSVQVSAYDAQGNESSLSSSLTVSTNSNDTEAPTAPQNLINTSKTDISVGLSWDASTDNVGVDSYDVYVDGVFNLNSTSTQTTVFGLTSNTTYEFSVKAKDDAGNESGFSNTIQVRTL